MSTTTPTTATSKIAGVIPFFAELVGRLFSKTPAFFKVIQVVSTIVAVVTGLPSIITSTGITLPPAFTALESTAVSVAAIVSLFISSLPVETPVVTSTATTTTTVVAASTPTVTVKSS